MAEWHNKLFFGDNLDILRTYIPNESVDLIYLDPPFNSQADYNVLYKEHSGEKSAAQITAFEDTWHWGLESEAAYQEAVASGPNKLGALLQALRTFLGQNDMMAYLTMMAPRLVELHRVLKPMGSIYLHCDPTASHYIKLLMDSVFGPERYRNEITWQRTNTHSDAKRWGRVADTILYYAKGSTVTWNPQYLPNSDKYVESSYRYEDERGRFYLSDMTSPKPRPNMMYEWKGFASPVNGWRYSRETMAELDAAGLIYYPDDNTKRPRRKRYLEDSKGVVIGNVWADIPPIQAAAKERLGYPTQKPEALLERIVAASSNPGDVVLDPFCGCGTATAVAERLRRHWIGIDITHLAITLMINRLQDAFGQDLAPYEVVGDPKDLTSAKVLAERDRYQFEWWALGQVAARPAHDRKKGADTGVDGLITFFDDNSGVARRIAIQVKSGHVNASHVRDLKGVLDRDKAVIGVLVTLEEPSKPMIVEASSAGFYTSPVTGEQYPRVQILTIRDLLDGKVVAFPRYAATTFAQAPRQTKSSGAAAQQSLL